MLGEVKKEEDKEIEQLREKLQYYRSLLHTAHFLCIGPATQKAVELFLDTLQKEGIGGADGTKS